MGILIGLLGLVVFLGIAFLASNNKKAINFKAIGIMFGLQLAALFIMFKTSVGTAVVEAISNGVAKVVSYGAVGVDFVLGGLMVQDGASVFFINVLLIVVFTSTVLSILTYIGVLPIITKYAGGFLAKITGLPKIETFNAVNSIFFGQSEAILAVKGYLPKLNKNRLFIISTSAMASVAASTVGAYMAIAEPKYILTAMVLNMFNGLIVASIIAPVDKEVEEVDFSVKELRESAGSSFFDAVNNGALDGGKVALIVGAMLIAFLGIIAMLNGVFDALFGLTLQQIMGYVFSPVAWLTGVPVGELQIAGNLMGTKLVANEFVAFLDFTSIRDVLSAKAEGVITVFLTSFAAVGSIGMVSGTVQAVNGVKGKAVAEMGLKILFAATLVSCVSATVVGLFL